MSAIVSLYVSRQAVTKFLEKMHIQVPERMVVDTVNNILYEHLYEITVVDPIDGPDDDRFIGLA